MSEIYRLYIGLVENGEWYNYAQNKEIQGGVLSLLDTRNDSISERIKLLTENSLDCLYKGPDGEGELKVTKEIVQRLKLDDAWKVSMEARKDFLGTDKPIIKESFLCHQCSVRGSEKYTTVEESWDELIDKGVMDEIYLDSSDCSRKTVLPVGIKISGTKIVANGVYTTLTREPLTLGQFHKISQIEEIMSNKALFLGATWDAQVKEIEGMSDRDLNVLKRNKKEPFTKKYLISKDDIDAMVDTFQIGIDPKFRTVTCRNCQSEIGGGLDFTNFFDFIFPKSLNQSINQS